MIKKISFYFVCFVLLSAFQCSEDDPEIIATVDEPNMVTVDNNQTVFSIDEDIIINTVIPNEVTSTEGETLLLTDYLVNYEESLSYWLYAYKYSDDGLLQGVPIPFAEAEIGNVLYEDLDHGMSISNPIFNDDAFVSSIKFKLSEPGTYYIGGGFYDSYTNHQKIQIIPYNGTNGQVKIFTSIVNENEDGLYEFIVE